MYKVNTNPSSQHQLNSPKLAPKTKGPSPHSSSNIRILEFVDRATDNWVSLGSDPNDAKSLIQILYRASTKTFQSPRIMRHLVSALEAVGEYTDAERSLDAYTVIIENQKRTMAVETVPDEDSDEDILRTLARGLRILVKFLGKGGKAVKLAWKMEGYVKEWEITTPETLASVYHAIGTANALWSMQSAPPLQSILT
jgi:cargo-transport protein YPP1